MDRIEVLREFYDHLVTREGNYIDVHSSWVFAPESEDDVFLEWVRQKLREEFGDEPR